MTALNFDTVANAEDRATVLYTVPKNGTKTPGTMGGLLNSYYGRTFKLPARRRGSHLPLVVAKHKRPLQHATTAGDLRVAWRVGGHVLRQREHALAPAAASPPPSVSSSLSE